jgi:hypothetical protein
VRSVLVGLAVAGALAACSSANDVTTAAKASLDRHQAQWEQRTIDELFADAQAALGQKHTTLQMDFDEQYGYPTVLVINSRTPAGPYSAQLSNLALKA